MKKILLSIFIGVSLSFSALSQVVVAGVSPASIQGNYKFAVQTDKGWPRYFANQFAPQSEYWGMNLDFSVQGTYIQDTLVLVNDGSSGTDPILGNPVSQEGCNPSPANAYAGKIALVRRNNCSFVNKVLYAQNAGAIAVIVVDNIDDDNIENNYMSAAANDPNGPLATIPAVRISMSDGNRIIAEMQNGPVVMFIGNKLGAFQNDLGLNQDLVATPSYHGVHFALAQDGTDFNFDLGLRIYNSGIQNQPNSKVIATVTGPTGTVYNHDFDFSLDAGDSLDIFPGENLSFPKFELNSYPQGEYTLEYELVLDGVSDDFTSDNKYSVSFVVNDTYHSRARLNPITSKPMATSQSRPSDPTTGAAYSEIMYCMSFRHPNADRVNLLGLNSVISIDSVNASSSLSGLFAMAEVYEWVNADAVYLGNTGLPATQPAYNLQLLTSNPAEHAFENDVLKEEVNFQFPDAPITLENNKVYLACITDYGQKLKIGYDVGVNYNINRQLTSQWINPLKILQGSTPTWYGGGFGPDATPAFGVHLESVDPTLSIGEQLTLEGRVYPNPANDIVRINVPMNGKAMITVTDLTGRNATTQSVNFLNNEASIDLLNLESGMYVVNVVFENGSKSTFNVVKR
jgi:hypothetical protein